MPTTDTKTIAAVQAAYVRGDIDAKEFEARITALVQSVWREQVLVRQRKSWLDRLFGRRMPPLPLRQKPILIAPVDGHRPEMTVITDDEGYFEIRGLAPGDYTVRQPLGEPKFVTVA